MRLFLKAGKFLLPALACTGWSASDACQPSQARAQVVRLEPASQRGAVQIRRANLQATMPAARYDYLCDEDEISVLEETARAHVVLAGRDRPIVVDGRMRHWQVPPRSQIDPLGWLDTEFRRLRSLLFGRRRQPPETTSTHSGSIAARTTIGTMLVSFVGAFIGRTTAEPAGALDVHPLIGSETQYLPRGTMQFSLVWTGGASRLVVEDVEGDVVRSDRVYGTTSHVVRLSQPTNQFTRLSVIPRSGGEWIGYELVPADPGQIPMPPQLRGRTALTAQERLGRALWLLSNSEEGQREWRLFAVSELQLLSSEFIIADQVIRQLEGKTRPDEMVSGPYTIP